ncbi:hypothetical protein [Desulfothermobacter acidiphilus]|uniref:hypothetical protein n=1 Tax=Desulfothermobacter acidiphilus TaxID=1938353 RepID=UPI003F899AD0
MTEARISSAKKQAGGGRRQSTKFHCTAVVTVLILAALLLCGSGCNRQESGRLQQGALQPPQPAGEEATRQETELPACWIYFIRDKKNSMTICRLDIPKKSLVQVTTAPASDTSPRPGPQGLAWIRHQTDQQTGKESAVLYLADFEGSQPRRLTPEDWQVTAFCWSPLGDELFFIALRPQPNRTLKPAICAVTTGGGVKTLAAYGKDFTFYPDERQLAQVFDGWGLLVLGSGRSGEKLLWYVDTSQPGKVAGIGEISLTESRVSFATDGGELLAVAEGVPYRPEVKERQSVKLALWRLNEEALASGVGNPATLLWERVLTPEPPAEGGYELVPNVVSFAPGGDSILCTVAWQGAAGSGPVVRWELWVADAASGEARRVWTEHETEKEYFALPNPDATFTPDGRGVIFCRGLAYANGWPADPELLKQETGDLWFLDLVTGESLRLTGPGEGRNWAPAAWQKPRPVESPAEALALVRAHPAVKRYLERVKQNGGDPRVDFDHEEGDRYIVHVYEVVRHPEESHTATFRWFAVEKGTGSVYSAL